MKKKFDILDIMYCIYIASAFGFITMAVTSICQLAHNEEYALIAIMTFVGGYIAKQEVVVSQFKEYVDSRSRVPESRIPGSSEFEKGHS